VVDLVGNPEEWLAAVILIAASHEHHTVVEQYRAGACVAPIETAPDQNAIESFCPEPTLELESPPRKSPHIETAIEFSTASPPMGLLLIKPMELLLFSTGADSEMRLRLAHTQRMTCELTSDAMS